MLALVVESHGPVDSLQLRDHAQPPAPGTGEVLVEVHAASINFPDLMVVAGTYQNLPQCPFVPGKDLAGRVLATGPGVRRLQSGDRIMAHVEHGAFAQRVLVPEQQCHVMPSSMSYRQGAAMGLAYLTAHFALVERARMQPGEIVMVTGAAGGVGLAAVQVARALGATVVAAVGSEAKARFVAAQGAHHVVRTDRPSLRDALREQVYAAVGKRGVDVVIDPVGGDVFDASLRTLAWCGRLVIVGFAEGRIPEVKAGLLLVKNISLIGLQVSDYRDRAPHKVDQVQDELHRLFERGSLSPSIMATFPLQDYRAALRTVQDRAVLGKVVLDLCGQSSD